MSEQVDFNPDSTREQKEAPEFVYHASPSGDVQELEPRRGSIPGGANPETQPQLVYAGDVPAFAAAHGFPWGSDEGFELGVVAGQVLFRVPRVLKGRLSQPVYVYTLPGAGFRFTLGEGTGHTFESAEKVKPTKVESFTTVQEAIEHFGGTVEYYDPQDSD
ncbi:MAG: hypothetical protein Q8O51_00205 [bacterium]|nr:hypothetical protein [bacterium]